jgi:hypothetical protein
MNADQPRDLAERLRAMFAPGNTVADGCRVAEVREAPGEVVLLMRRDRDPHLYGIPVSLGDTRHEFYYSDCEVSSDDEWLDSVDIGLMVMLDTGYVATARRRQVDDYIELRDVDGWPDDRRFTLQDGGDDMDLLAGRLREVGLDPSAALEQRARNRLQVWMLASENNSTGGPWVGHAVVSRSGKAEAILEVVETSPEVPPTVALDLAYFACHSAAAAGVERVWTELPDEVLALAGFVSTPDGRQVLDTNFLAADPDGARALLATDLDRQVPWGQDRDLAGRHVPPSVVGRTLHRLRFGKSGRRPKMWAG